MNSNCHGYEMKKVAQNYIKYRPTYNADIYDMILKYLELGSDGNGKRGLAVDIACGSGQGTLPLAEYFEKVIGIDSSDAQLNEARKVSLGNTKIVYKLGSAEDLSSIVEDDSVDLVTVAEAMHWFNTKEFLKECQRVLKPGGVLAVYTYFFPIFGNQEANKLFKQFIHETMRSYWQKELDHIFNEYKDIEVNISKFFEECVR